MGITASIILMTLSIHIDAVVLCFCLIAGTGGMLAIKYWKNK